MVLGTGNAALAGHDLTDPEDDGTPTGQNYAATFTASHDAGFGADLAFAVFDNAVTGAGVTWCCTGPNPSIWVAAEFGSPVVLRSFTLARGPAVPGLASVFNDNFDAERNADVWRIQGSNDGNAWNDIYVWDRDGVSPFTDASQVIAFRSGIGPGADYVEPPAYTRFRYLVESVIDEISSLDQLAELELFGTAVGPAAAAWYVAPPPLGASDNTCTTAEEPCMTLQQAVDKAAAGDFVYVASGTYPDTTIVSKSLEIVGAGSGATVFFGAAEEPRIRVSGSDVRLRGLSIDGDSDSAGAILHTAGDLFIADCDFTGNDGVEAGAVHSSGHSLRVSRTRFFSNHTFADAGGIRESHGRLYVGQSLFLSNEALALGAAILVGPFTGSDPAPQGWITGSTFAENGSDDGSVIVAGYASRLAVLSSTVTGSVPRGSDVVRGAVSNYVDLSEVVLRGVLLADEVFHCFREDTGLITNAITSYGYNFAEGASCPWLDKPSDHTGAVVADLGPIGDNGGPLETRVPGPSSGARDAGECRSSVDARGFARPVDQPVSNAAGGDGCDIGAVEVQLAAPANLIATPSGRNIDLSWSDLAREESGFEIERTPAPSPAGTAADVTSTSDTAVTCEAAYSYRVRAVRTVAGFTDYSNWSNTAEATAGTCELFSSGFEPGDPNWSATVGG